MGEEMKDRELWFRNVLEAVNRLSRTTHGVSDTSSATEKPTLLVGEGKILIERTSMNLQRAMEYLWDNSSISFKSSSEVMDFINFLAMTVSEGLLQAGQSLYRTWMTPFGQTPPPEIAADYQNFCEWFFLTLDHDDPIATAAIVEKRLNGEIHPFADGCGRTSMLLAAFVLLRHHLDPVLYRSRKEYHEMIGHSGDEEWINYYRSLVIQLEK